MEPCPSFYCAVISTFATICQAAGVGIAVGMMAGATGLHGSARGRMTVLAAILGLLAGFFAASVSNGSTGVGAIVGLIAAALTCPLISDVVAGASRRGGTAALALLITFVALVLLALSLVVPYLALLAVIALAWLAISRRRRSQRKYEGLRILR